MSDARDDLMDWPAWAARIELALECLLETCEKLDTAGRVLVCRADAAMLLSVPEEAFPHDIPSLILDGVRMYRVQSLHDWAARAESRGRAA